MGNLCSCIFGNKNEEGERDRLLTDPTSNSSYYERDTNEPYRSSHLNAAPPYYEHNPYMEGNRELCEPGGNSSQNMTAWDHTLHKLQEKLIDVTTLNTGPTSSFEATEGREKEIKYQKFIMANERIICEAIDQVKASLKFTSLQKASDALNSSHLIQPIDAEQLHAIEQFSRQAKVIHNQVFTIDVSDDIVVPFPSP